MGRIILKEIYKESINQLKNLSKKHNKLFICFVGIPGSGKTYLAKKIEERYKGVRINSDDIRKIIYDKVNKSKKEEILENFLLNFLKTFSFENKLILLDSGIERKYKDIYKISKEGNWARFIIRVDVPKKTIMKRLMIKDPERMEEHPEDAKRWFKEYKEFNKKIKSDFIFKNNSDLKRLFLKLDKIIS